MRVDVRVCVLLWMAAGLLAQAPPDPSERLVRARDMLAGRDRHLPDYTCLQTVERRYLKRRHPDEPPPSCGQLHALPASEWKLELSDRLRLEIKASEGKEIGSWKGSRFTESDVFKLTAGGPYSTGMLGSWITDIFLNGGATYQYLGADAYRYQVPLAASHYLIKAGSQWVTAPFSGAFWLDPNSADLKHLLVEADNLPPETNTCYVNTSVRYEWTQVGAGKFLLPSQSDMRILMRNGREDQTTAVYSGCREYLGESTIRFDEAPAAGPDRAPAAETTPLPPGLHLELALTEPIDSDTAAAGDVVHARLRELIRYPRSRKLLAARGAAVEGRIVAMQHWLEEPRHFIFSLALEKIETESGPRPVFARLELGQRKSFVLPPMGQSPLVATLYFETREESHRIPAGYQMEWVTVKPPVENQ